MSEQIVFNGILIGWSVLALFTFISLFFVVAPYGRHIRSGWGLTVNNKLAWILMESASPIVFAVCFVIGSNARTAAVLLFFSLWEIHYVHRAFIYPFGLRDGVKRMPVAIMATAFIFNTGNAYLNGRYIFTLSDGYTAAWLSDPRFICGLCLFIVGFVINRQADYILRNLRKPGETDYKVPYGGLYHWISCPNYFGEILIWVGWAVMTWSLPGLVFALWTVANLMPRARAHHQWYRTHFAGYPAERKALIPLVW
jgi:3-oxo-5-alpha-steroid 4-dehydrogenase 1